MRPKGYVYIISNKSLKGLFKIGYTLKDPILRAKDLNPTGLPHPYKVEYEIYVDDPRSLEQKVHHKLKAYNEGKEWFRCDFSQCLSAIQTCYSGKIYFENLRREPLKEEIKIDNPVEQNILGYKYYTGEGVKQDYIKAIKYFTLAAQQGYANAQLNLGIIHHKYSNFEEAYFWYNQASRQGLAQAQYNLGILYLNGLGVQKDYDKAKDLFIQASKQGFKKAVIWIQKNIGKK